jgi:nucleotide-binding universal stress UspA family protein
VACEVTVVPGTPAEHLVQIGDGAALLVVGSRGCSRLPGMVLGSVALHCAVNAPCPALVVHPPCPALVVHPQREADRAPAAPAFAASGG